jgi:hypothetical protein
MRKWITAYMQKRSKSRRHGLRKMSGIITHVIYICVERKKRKQFLLNGSNMHATFVTHVT